MITPFICTYNFKKRFYSFDFYSIKRAYIGTDTSPGRLNRENPDLEVSKNVENTAKNNFLQKKHFFPGKLLGRDTSFAA